MQKEDQKVIGTKEAGQTIGMSRLMSITKHMKYQKMGGSRSLADSYISIYALIHVLLTYSGFMFKHSHICIHVHYIVTQPLGGTCCRVASWCLLEEIPQGGMHRQSRPRRVTPQRVPLAGGYPPEGVGHFHEFLIHLYTFL